MSDTAFLTIYGLNEGIDTDGCGMRSRISRVAGSFGALRGIVPDMFWATWDGNGMKFPVDQALDRLSGYDKIILGGHSFGVARAIWLANRYRGRILHLFAFDGAPNVGLGQNFPWKDADADPTKRWAMPACVESWVSFTQRNDVFISPETGVGVCGVPFVPDDRGINIDTNHYGPAPGVNLGLTHAGDRGVCMCDALYATIAAEMIRAANTRLNVAWNAKQG